MNGIPTGTELVRPFIPTRDFELSRRFYEMLGFENLVRRGLCKLQRSPWLRCLT